MRIAVDTNVLLRVVLADDATQHGKAIALLERATVVVLPTTALCEAAWVLNRTYALGRQEIAEALEILLRIENAVYDTTAVEAGMALLAAGADFADGVIARQGADSRAEVFVSFDHKAVKRLNVVGISASVPGDLNS